MNKNWYKEAKLADLSKTPGRAEPVVCQKCSRWLTHNEEGNPAWKFYYNMKPAEQAEVDKMKKMFDVGRTAHQVAICPNCQK